MLLQEGEFTRREKQLKKKMSVVSGIYWCLVTAIYLGWSFLTMQWNTTWMVWPVAGVLYGAVEGIIKLAMRDSFKA